VISVESGFAARPTMSPHAAVTLDDERAALARAHDAAAAMIERLNRIETYGSSGDVFTDDYIANVVRNAVRKMQQDLVVFGRIDDEHTWRVGLYGIDDRGDKLVIDWRAPPDLSRQTLGSLLLLINARDSDLVAAVSGAGSSDALIEATLQEDVSCRLLDFAVENADELLHGDWEEGSMGEMLARLAARADGGLEGLRDLLVGNPARYQSVLMGEARRSGLGRILP
jgi:hypothetical protein